MDDLTYANFFEYLTITQEPGQYGVNNVLFWLELQRCKVSIFMYYNECQQSVPGQILEFTRGGAQKCHGS